MSPYRTSNHAAPPTLLQQHDADRRALLATVTHVALVDRGVVIDTTPITCRDEHGVPSCEAFRFQIWQDTPRHGLEAHLVDPSGRVVHAMNINGLQPMLPAGSYLELTLGETP